MLHAVNMNMSINIAYQSLQIYARVAPVYHHYDLLLYIVYCRTPYFHSDVVVCIVVFSCLEGVTSGQCF